MFLLAFSSNIRSKATATAHGDQATATATSSVAESGLIFNAFYAEITSVFFVVIPIFWFTCVFTWCTHPPRYVFGFCTNREE
jgi:hypothetical protein